MANIILSDGEWKLMRAIWANQPCSLGQLVVALDEETHWTKSTIFVMCRRLIAKGAVMLDTTGKIQLYSAIVTEKECADRESHAFLSRVYHGSVGLLLSSLAGQKALSKDEIGELKKILDEAESSLEE